MKEPPARSKTPGKKGSGRGRSGERPEVWTDRDGVKKVWHCHSFLDTGKCKWEADNPGKKCKIPHLNKDQVAKKIRDSP